LHYCRILIAERNRSARETRNGRGACPDWVWNALRRRNRSDHL